MYENIKELINNSNYNEAKKIIVEELKNNENEELWYLLFLAENNNYLDFDPNNINNTYAYNQATKSNNEEYVFEFKLYKELALMNLNKIFRLIQIEKYDEVDELLKDNKVINFKLSMMSSVYLNEIIIVTDKIKLKYNLEFLNYVYENSKSSAVLEMKDRLLGYIIQKGIDISEDLSKIDNNNDKVLLDENETLSELDFKLDGDTLVKYNGQDKKVTIPEGVTSIGNRAFEGCTSLTSITIPSSVTSIGDQAFDFCFRLVEIYNLSSLNITIGSDENGNIGKYAKVIHTSLNEKSDIVKKDDYIFIYDDKNYYLVDYVGKDTELVLPEDIYGNGYIINDYAFYYYENIISMTIPNGIIDIGKSSFLGCCRLVEIYNLSSIKLTIYSNDYEGIGDYVKVIHTSIREKSDIIKKDDYIFIYDDNNYYLVAYEGNNTSLILPKDILGNNYIINDYAFYDCNKLSSIIIPNSVTSIGYCAFFGCGSLTSITIPSSVTSIGDWSFGYCRSLTNITIPSSVTSIGKYSFLGCIKLTSIEIPNGVTSIGYEAFRDCSSLTSITIPSSVTSIGTYAFRDCSNLTSITIQSTVKNVGNEFLAGCNNLKTIYCSKNNIDIIKKTLSFTKRLKIKKI